MAVNGTPVQSAVGTLDKDKLKNLHTGNDRPTRIKTYKRTYQHYINNTNSAPNFTARTLFNVGTTPTPLPGIEWNEGLFPIPYYNLGAALDPGKYSREFANVGRVKLLSLGYTIKKISVMQETLTTRGSTTVVENTFEGKPFFMRFRDRQHLFDQCVGYAGATTAVQAGCMAYTESSQNAQGIAYAGVMPTFTNVNQLYPGNASSSNMVVQWPASQAQGNMKQASFYVRVPNTNSEGTAVAPGGDGLVPGDGGTGVSPVAPASCYLSILDYIDCDVLSEQDEISFTWHNRLPAWRNTTRQDQLTFGSLALQTGQLGTIANGWPANRVAALSEPYRLSLANEVEDWGEGTLVSSQGSLYLDNPNIPPSDANNFSDVRPEVHYLKMNPVYGPVGQITLVGYLVIEYHMTLELEDAAYTFPLQNMFTYNVTGAFTQTQFGNVANQDPNFPYTVPGNSWVNYRDTRGAATTLVDTTPGLKDSDGAKKRRSSRLMRKAICARK